MSLVPIKKSKTCMTTFCVHAAIVPVIYLYATHICSKAVDDFYYMSGVFCSSWTDKDREIFVLWYKLQSNLYPTLTFTFSVKVLLGLSGHFCVCGSIVPPLDQTQVCLVNFVSY